MEFFLDLNAGNMKYYNSLKQQQKIIMFTGIYFIFFKTKIKLLNLFHLEA